MQSNVGRFPLNLSIKSKLILSYLAVILSTVLILSLVVSTAANQFFFNWQVQTVDATADSLAQQLTTNYSLAGRSWEPILHSLQSQNMLLILNSSDNTQQVCSQPESPIDNCVEGKAHTEAQQALQRTQQTNQKQSGTIIIPLEHQNISSVYVSIPLSIPDRDSGQNRIIGYMFLSQPLYSSDLSKTFLHQMNQAILLVSIGVTLLAVIGSLLFVRRFTRPLVSLTEAAAKMKQGEYTQRVTPPNPHDELGRLAQTFNEMAGRIEADVSELRRQDRVRRDLVANIAHDLATPLTAIQGFSEALADDIIADPQTRQETAQRIGREVQRLKRMVADIRQVSSLEANQVQLDLAPLDLHDLVEETLAVIAPEYEQQHIRVSNEIDPTMLPVLVDGDRITQVLLNLLDNARRHTPAGGSIHVGASAQGQQLLTWISDTGTGIDPADLPHIFERFYRADHSRTTSTGGSGLGLAIVKAIITAHGGNVWAESEPGKGTKIFFTLPVVPSAPAPKETCSAASTLPMTELKS